LGLTVRKAAVERQPTLPAARAERVGEWGFALIEILCVLAIIGLLAAIILPAIPRATSRATLESYAVQMAALLKADRNTALRRQIQVTRIAPPADRSISFRRECRVAACSRWRVRGWDMRFASTG
jgi:general secretion pathway protein H